MFEGTRIDTITFGHINFVHCKNWGVMFTFGHINLCMVFLHNNCINMDRPYDVLVM